MTALPPDGAALPGAGRATGTADRATVWFLAAVAAYLLLQAGLRTALGGTLEVDEAEILLLSQAFAWGYGPQPPLYNWAQAAVFAVLGPGTAGLALLKAAVLWLAAAGLWFGMRAAFGPGRAAAAAALSVALLPNILWEFQRASTHSVALLAAVTWTLWAWFTLRQRPTLRNWLVLGAILGLGGLSKLNFWAVPAALVLADLRQGPKGRGALAAVALAAAIVALPYAWAVMHPAESLASLHKFHPPAAALPPAVQGLAAMAEGLALGLALPAVVWLGLWGATGRRLPPMPAATAILLRAAGLGVAAAAVLVVAFGVAEVSARWLVPVLLLLTVAMFGWLGAGLSRRAFRVLPVAALVCAGLTVAGMVDLRRTGTGTLDLGPLVALVERVDPARIDGGYLLAGNLKLLLPDRRITAGVPPAPGERVLRLGEGATAAGEAAQSGRIVLRHAGDPDRRLAVDWQLFE